MAELISLCLFPPREPELPARDGDRVAGYPGLVWYQGSWVTLDAWAELAGPHWESGSVATATTTRARAARSARRPRKAAG